MTAPAPRHIDAPTLPRPLLLPLVPLYRLALAARGFALRTGLEPIRRLAHPVLAIGNLSTGGAGKTPLTIALAQALVQRGFSADILSRGFGRHARHAARVLPNGLAQDFGDEPLLIARQTGLPVYVASRRFHAGLLAESEIPADNNIRPHLHLLDDGFQHRQLHRDIDILLLDSPDLRGHLLPAGNLREPISALRRATVLAIPADAPQPASALEAALRARGWQGPVWRLRRVMQVPAVPGPVLAFCGIARPAQFFAGLQASGISLAARRAFPDHHPYTPRDLQTLIAAARSSSATALLTTEKDLARLGPLASTLPASLPILPVPLRTEIESAGAALDWLQSKLA